jgi:hypothetical protein
MIGLTKQHPEWRLIIEALKERPYGSSISHAELAAVADLQPQTRRYFSQVNRARKTLLDEWQRELETVQGAGYRLVEPSEFFGRVRRGIRLIGRRARATMRVAAAAPSHLLTDQENAKMADVQSKLGSLESQRRRLFSSTRPSLPLATQADVPKLLQP